MAFVQDVRRKRGKIRKKGEGRRRNLNKNRGMRSRRCSLDEKKIFLAGKPHRGG